MRGKTFAYPPYQLTWVQDSQTGPGEGDTLGHLSYQELHSI